MVKNLLNRRQFMKKASELTAYAAFGAALHGLLRGTSSAAPGADILVAHGDPAPATRAALNALGGMGRFVKSGDKVVIKPNMSFPNPPHWATTTHPDVVRELVLLCHEAGASSVMVLDNPLRKAEVCLERSGLKEVCAGVPHCSVRALANRRFFERVEVPKGRELKATMILRPVLEADVLIAAPVAKSHSATGISLAMKGMMGLIYDRKEFHRDLNLDIAIVDLCTLLTPQLTVIDASRILSAGGPGGPGKVIPLNKVVASTDMVAADAMAVELGTWYGRNFKARQVKHINMAHQRSLGNMEITKRRLKEVVA
jgi:uncharacterized protein (DUF362 family)